LKSTTVKTVKSCKSDAWGVWNQRPQSSTSALSSAPKLLTSASEERRQKTSQAVQLRAELQGQRSIRRRLEAGMQEAVSVLRDLLTVRTMILDQEL